VRDYSTWMEDMFGDGWLGNDRITPDLATDHRGT
jgi:hypothetical protein